MSYQKPRNGDILENPITISHVIEKEDKNYLRRAAFDREISWSRLLRNIIAEWISRDKKDKEICQRPK